MKKGIPVLMYHALEDDDHPAGAKERGEQIYILQRSVFEEQMEYLAEMGIQPLLFSDLTALKNWPERSVILTFDDGHESNYFLALPILKKYGFRAEFYITTDWVGTPNYLTKEQILLLHQAGMVVGSHGVSHTFLDDLSDREIKRELLQSKNFLAEIVGEKINSFSAPGGRLKKTAVIIAQQVGYKVVCTSNFGVFSGRHSLYAVPRIPLQMQTSTETFKSLVQQDAKLLYRLMLRKRVLDFAKILIGNQRYEKWRKFAMQKF